ncbi:MAG: hypothetical protein NT165_03610 [Candidatus Falkowbacteria bacterium]|nr:hypothetical protein [Candidatus Falkowbacteria bacterium]
MNKANHKALGRYAYGGKIFLGECHDCGREHYLTVDQVQEVVSNSYLKPKTSLQRFRGRVELFQRALGTLMFSFIIISLADFAVEGFNLADAIMV